VAHSKCRTHCAILVNWVGYFNGPLLWVGFGCNRVEYSAAYSNAWDFECNIGAFSGVIMWPH